MRWWMKKMRVQGGWEEYVRSLPKESNLSFAMKDTRQDRTPSTNAWMHTHTFYSTYIFTCHYMLL